MQIVDVFFFFFGVFVISHSKESEAAKEDRHDKLSKWVSLGFRVKAVDFFVRSCGRNDIDMPGICSCSFL